MLYMFQITIILFIKKLFQQNEHGFYHHREKKHGEKDTARVLVLLKIISPLSGGPGY